MTPTPRPAPPRIQTEIWEASPGRPGFVRWKAQRSMTEVKADLIETLQHIDASDPGEDFYSADDVREWISPSTYTDTDLTGDFPRGEPFLTVVKGPNEGYHILIMCRARLAGSIIEGNAVTAFTIKYLIGRDAVWNIAQALDRAFEIY
jgi:hypothetical protein